MCVVLVHFVNVPIDMLDFHAQDNTYHGRQAFGDPTRQGPIATLEHLANDLAW